MMTVRRSSLEMKRSDCSCNDAKKHCGCQIWIRTEGPRRFVEKESPPHTTANEGPYTEQQPSTTTHLVQQARQGVRERRAASAPFAGWPP